MLYSLPLFVLFLAPLASSLPAITPSEVISPPAYLTLQIYHDANPNTPCTGRNGTLNWPVDNTNPNSTDQCFDTKTHHMTCIRRMFQQFDDFRVDTTPRICSLEGFQQSACGGPSYPASYNGTAEWTWDGMDMTVDVQSFKMTCGASRTPSRSAEVK